MSTSPSVQTCAHAALVLAGPVSSQISSDLSHVATGSGVRAPEQLVMVARAFIDEPLLHASALQALPAADGAGPPRDTVASEATHSFTGVVTGPHVRQEAASNPMASTTDADGDKVGIGVTFKRDGDGFFMVKRLSENGGAITSGLAVGIESSTLAPHPLACPPQSRCCPAERQNR